MALIASPSPGASIVHHAGTTQNDFANPPSTRSLQPSAGLSRGQVSSASTGGQLAALANGQDTGSRRYQLGDQIKPTPYDLLSEPQELTRARTGDQSLADRSRPHATRRRTDYEVEHQVPAIQPVAIEEAGELRHGWEDQYNSSEFLGQLSSVRTYASLCYTPLQLLTWIIIEFLHVLHRQAT